MNKTNQVENLAEPDLIDRIADALPIEVRSEYYRELRHCQSLPKNDEMLRILRAMQFLTLLTVEVPGKVAVERGKLEQLFMAALKKLQDNYQASQTYQEQLDAHLVSLPNKIAEGISPAAVVAKINESLKQEFLRSTIPQTGEALRLVGGQMKFAADEFVSTAKELTHSYRGVTENANQAIERMKGSISSAAAAARGATQDLSRSFRRHYRWALYALSSLALLVGIGIGMLFQHWIEDPPVRKLYIYQKDSPGLVPIPGRRP